MKFFRAKLIKLFRISFFSLFVFEVLPAYAIPKTVPSGSYQIQAGDRVQIAVYREEDLSGSYQVDPAGTLSFPLVGDLQVAGLRVDELIEHLTRELKKYLVNPQVTISRGEGSVKSISILGHVQKPGNFDYLPGLTVMRLISQAGGFERSANQRKIRVVRMVEGQKQVMIVNGSDVINGKADDPPLEPGDMIFVSEAIF